MNTMRITLFFTLFWAAAGSAQLPCPVQLTTSFALGGPLIAGVAPEGRLTILEDRFEPGPERTPALTTKTVALPLNFHRQGLRGVTSLPAPGAEDGAYYAVVGRDGQLTLFLPDGRALPMLLPNGKVASAAAFFRTPAATEQDAILGSDGIRSREERGRLRYADSVGFFNRGEEDDMLRRTETRHPMDLYIAAGRNIYRAELRQLELPKDEKLRTQVRQGPTLIEIARVSSADASDIIAEWTPAAGAFVDFSKLSDWNRLLVALPQDGWALEVRNLETVATLGGDIDMTQADFLHAIDDDTLVVASEIGQVQVRSRSLHAAKAIQFPTMTWLTSLSAHRSPNGIEIYAVNAIDSKLYHWNSRSLAPLFKAVDYGSKTSPLRVATFGGPVSSQYRQKERGYLTNFTIDGGFPVVEQILVLDVNGGLHAHQDQLKLGEIHAERAWIQVPFLDIP